MRGDIHRAFAQFNRVLAEASTGAGKTTIFAAIVQDFVSAGSRVLVIVNRERLVVQAAERIQKQTGLDVDIEMAGEHASPHAQVVVASVQTLMRINRLTGFSDFHFQLVICDEAHHVKAAGWVRILLYFQLGAHTLAEEWKAPAKGEHYESHCKILGVTATPEEDLGHFFEHAIEPYGLIQAVEDGWLVPPVMKCLPLKIDLRGLRAGRTVNGSDLKPNELEARLIPVLEALADQIVEHASDRKTIVFTPSVNCARLMTEAVNRRGLNGMFVSGECLDIDEKTQKFISSGRGTVLSNCAVWTEGADFPDIDCVMVARATKCRGFYRQMVGRGFRPLPGAVDGLATAEERRAAIAASEKKDLLVLDPLWRSEIIDLCDAFDLYASAPEVKELMKKTGELTPDNAKESERDFLKALEKEAKKHAKKQAKVINPLAASVLVTESGVAGYVPENAAQAGPVTAIQKEYLLAAGFTHYTPKCAGEADLIIRRLETRKRGGFATPLQLSFLLQIGFPEEQAAMMKARQAGAIVGAKMASWRR